MNAMVMQRRQSAIGSDSQEFAVGRNRCGKQIAVCSIGDRWPKHALRLARFEIPEANRFIEPYGDKLPRVLRYKQLIDGVSVAAGVKRQKWLVIVGLIVDLRHLPDCNGPEQERR